MNTPNIQKWIFTINEVFFEVEYFLEFNRRALFDVLNGGITLLEFWEISNENYSKAMKRSQALDAFYNNGSMWRLAITEWWPNEIQYYKSEQEKCIDILWELWVR